MPTADVLARTVKWDTLTHQNKLSLVKLFYKCYGMPPHALAEKLIIHSKRSVSRTKSELIVPRFGSNYDENSIAYRGGPLERYRSLRWFYFRLYRYEICSEKSR